AAPWNMGLALSPTWAERLVRERRPTELGRFRGMAWIFFVSYIVLRISGQIPPWKLLWKFACK
ncbi:MAG: hypothetical protein RR739_08535, partial [Clostridia bacterium]